MTYKNSNYVSGMVSGCGKISGKLKKCPRERSLSEEPRYNKVNVYDISEWIKFVLNGRQVQQVWGMYGQTTCCADSLRAQCGTGTNFLHDGLQLLGSLRPPQPALAQGFRSLDLGLQGLELRRLLDRR